MAVKFETILSDNDYALQKLTVSWLMVIKSTHWFVGKRVTNIKPYHIAHYPALIEDGIVNADTLEVDLVKLANWHKAIYEPFIAPMNETDARALYKAHTDKLENVYGG